jgi:hypothetical protein
VKFYTVVTVVTKDGEKRKEKEKEKKKSYEE